MKKTISFILCLTMLLSVSLPCYAAGDIELNINKKSVIHKVSPLLYGISIEDVSCACDGGLVSELVKNGSFEYTAGNDASWKCFGAASVVTNEYPMNDNNRLCQKLTLDGKGTLKNIGYNEIYKPNSFKYDEASAEAAGMGFKENEKYEFSCYFKNVDYNGSISVYLDSKKNSSNVVILPVSDIGTNEWSKVSATLTSETDENGGLAISFDGKGSILLDNVSLVPKSSYGYGTNQWKYISLREDLLNALKNLNPAFIRFPGGCIAEGSDLKNLYSWKNTIGPLEERKQEESIYQDTANGRYVNNSNSMGYHEYFQLCEDLNSEPVPVVSAGVTCQKYNGYEDYVIAKQKLLMSDEQWEAFLVNEKGYSKADRKGIEEYTKKIDSLGIKSEADFDKYLNTIALNPDSDSFTNYVQDIFDLIEYANGDSLTSYWGAMRAANGHEKPFNVEYIQIGNENYGEVYLRNLEAIYNRIKKKYPNIKIIADAGKSYEGEEFDNAWNEFSSKYRDIIVDEHLFTEDGYFFEHGDRYDSYDRSGAGVMVGEYYAEPKGSGAMIKKNNMLSAAEEASFLTGAERNSDIVKMTSFAPTLSKLRANAKENSLIWFDSQSLVLTPDYYVNLVFSNNTGDEYVNAEFNDADINDLYQSVTVDENRQVMYVKIVNTGSSKRIKINLNDFDDINSASVMSLKANGKTAYNDIEKQTVAPVEAELETARESVEIKAVSNSVNVVRIAYGGNNGEGVYHIPESMDLKTKGYTSVSTKLTVTVLLIAFGAGFAIGYIIIFRRIKKGGKNER
ncbi:MAG: hypothetical protein IJT65_08480 [Eubacterium sp.]|nr:hypothetical protein [Eubacterium sp.]